MVKLLKFVVAFSPTIWTKKNNFTAPQKFPQPASCPQKISTQNELLPKKISTAPAAASEMAEISISKMKNCVGYLY